MNGDLATLAQTLSGIGALGLIVWLVKRTFSHTIPRLVTDFRETLQRLTDYFHTELRVQREDFRRELQQQREDFKGQLQSLGSRVDRLTDAVDRLGVKISD